MNVKNNILKIMFLLLVFTFSFKVSALEYTNPNTNYKVICEDDANLIDTESINQLFEKMKQLSDYGNVAFKTTDSPGTTTEYYASSYYHSKFGAESGSLFLIDMGNRNVYIFSDGQNYKIINKSKAYSITDNVYRYAKNEEYYECAYNAFDQMLTILQGNKILEPMRYASDAFIAITISAFINFFIVMIKSTVRKASDKEILKSCKVKMEINSLTARKTGTHRVYSPQSDSSSGGSSGGGGGGGGGGGSSGGGGGHGF